MSLFEVAARAGAAPETVRHLENGERATDFALIAELARVYRVSVGWLMAEDGERDDARALVDELAALPAERRAYIREMIGFERARAYAVDQIPDVAGYRAFFAPR